MPRESRLSIARPDILKTFEDFDQKVFARADIEKILLENREFWRLAQSTTTNKFIEYLLKRTPLQQIRFDFPSRRMYRYTWHDADLLAVVQSLKANGYFTHFTAMHHHGLTEQIPKTVYLNFEQYLTGQGGTLTQAGIDRAFRNKPRTSNNIAEIGERRVCLLNGRSTNELGVIETTTDDGNRLRITSIERTLIDITVRPVYAGGPSTVATAFEMARDKVSINKLVSYLKKINYTYPFHQAIGFYLERAGYRDSQLQLLENIPMEFDFYLANRMGPTEYIERWRLFVPKRF